MQNSHLVSHSDDDSLKGNNNSCPSQEFNRHKSFCFCGQTTNYHSNDHEDLLKISDIFVRSIEQLEYTNCFFKELKKQICIGDILNPFSQTNLSTESYMNFTTNKATLIQLLCKELIGLTDYIVKVKDKLKIYKSQLDNDDFDLKKYQNPIEQQYQNNRKDSLNKQSQVQLNQQAIPNNQALLAIYFSKQNKHKEIVLQEQGKMVEGQGFCLCEQAISKFGGKFTFKIIKCGFLNQVYVGIGAKSFMQATNYDPKLSDAGHGLYVIQQNGYFYCHNNIEQNHKSLSFKFQPNDIITITVNKELKSINWTKKQSNETFNTKYNLSEEIYPVVGLSNGSLIKIMNEF